MTNEKKWISEIDLVTLNTVEIVDNYEHPDDNIEYILQNVLSDSEKTLEFEILQEQYNSAIFNSCTCSPTCSYLCPHGRNYTVLQPSKSSTPELVLNQCKLGDLIYECSTFCECPSDCSNRLVQYGPREHLEVVDSKMFSSKGRGLITTKDIPKGGFICEYAGELLTESEAIRRSIENEKHLQMNYILCLNEINSQDSTQNQKTFVDPRYKGNIGRYINHSCDPNCKTYSVRIDCPIPKVAIFADREILAGEELCFHYSGGAGKQNPSKTTFSKTCFCLSTGCEKYLPNISF